MSEYYVRAKNIKLICFMRDEGNEYFYKILETLYELFAETRKDYHWFLDGGLKRKEVIYVK